MTESADVGRRSSFSDGPSLAAQRLMAAAITPAESLREYGRGLAGGLIVSLPLLYTMEVWWTGFIARPERLLIYLTFIFLLLLGYNRYAGLRHDSGWLEVAIDSVEELGLGLVTSTGALFLLGRIGPGTTFGEGFAQVIVEGGIVAIGFSVGTAQLGTGDEGESGMGPRRAKDGRIHFGGQLAISLCGAVLFAANVAPTEEILMIAVETSPVRLLGVIAVSLLIAGLVLYFTNFTRASDYSPRDTHWQALSGTAITYAISLIASAAMLWFFMRLEGQSLAVGVSQCVVLALPAVLGASAGRLLLQR